MRQLNAHAWVEVLIARAPPSNVLPPTPRDKSAPTEKVSFHWLSLDPTPSGDGSDEAAHADDWLSSSEGFFKSFILFYDSDQRKNAMLSLVKNLEDFENALENGEVKLDGCRGRRGRDGG